MTSDQDGKFKMDLPEGVYTLTVTYPEYVTVKIEGINVAPNSVFSTIVHLRPGERTHN